MQPASDPLDRFEDSGNILSVIERAIREAAHEIGTVNILIAGRTGVGKSTLINEVFQGRLATTGQGEPVTKQTRRYTKKGIPLAIYDTRGLELNSCAMASEDGGVAPDAVNNLASTAMYNSPSAVVSVAAAPAATTPPAAEPAPVQLGKRGAPSRTC